MSSIKGNHIQAIEQQLAQQVISRCKQLARECEDITLVFDGGNISSENIEVVEASPYHFITSVTVTHDVLTNYFRVNCKY